MVSVQEMQRLAEEQREALSKDLVEVAPGVRVDPSFIIKEGEVARSKSIARARGGEFFLPEAIAAREAAARAEAEAQARLEQQRQEEERRKQQAIIAQQKQEQQREASKQLSIDLKQSQSQQERTQAELQFNETIQFIDAQARQQREEAGISRPTPQQREKDIILLKKKEIETKELLKTPPSEIPEKAPIDFIDKFITGIGDIATELRRRFTPRTRVQFLGVPGFGTSIDLDFSTLADLEIVQKGKGKALQVFEDIPSGGDLNIPLIGFPSGFGIPSIGVDVKEFVPAKEEIKQKQEQTLLEDFQSRIDAIPEIKETIEPEFQAEIQAEFNKQFEGKINRGEITFEDASKQFSESKKFKDIQKRFTIVVEEKVIENQPFVDKQSIRTGSKLFGLTLLGLVPTTRKEGIVTGGVAAGTIGAFTLLPGLFPAFILKEITEIVDPTTDPIERVISGIEVGGILAFEGVRAGVARVRRPKVTFDLLEPPASLLKVEDTATQTLPFGRKILRDLKGDIIDLQFFKAFKEQEIKAFGRKTTVSTPLREVLGIKPIFEGSPVDKIGRAKALNKLKSAGFSDSVAKQILRQIRPKDITAQTVADITVLFEAGKTPLIDIDAVRIQEFRKRKTKADIETLGARGRVEFIKSIGEELGISKKGVTETVFETSIREGILTSDQAVGSLIRKRGKARRITEQQSFTEVGVKLTPTPEGLIVESLGEKFLIPKTKDIPIVLREGQESSIFFEIVGQRALLKDRIPFRKKIQGIDDIIIATALKNVPARFEQVEGVFDIPRVLRAEIGGVKKVPKVKRPKRIKDDVKDTIRIDEDIKPEPFEFKEDILSEITPSSVSARGVQPPLDIPRGGKLLTAQELKQISTVSSLKTLPKSLTDLTPLQLPRTDFVQPRIGQRVGVITRVVPGLKIDLGLETELKIDLSLETKLQQGLETKQDLELEQELQLEQQLELQQELQLKQELELKQELDLISPAIGGGARAPTKLPKPPKPKRLTLPDLDFETPGRVRVGKAQRGFNVSAKRIKSDRLKRLNKVPITKRQALDLGSQVVDESLGRRFKVTATKKTAQTPRTKIQRGNFAKTRNKFRSFEQRKGKRFPLKDEFIELGKNLLDTPQEKKKIKIAQRVAQLRKPATKKRKSKQTNDLLVEGGLLN